MQPSRLFLISLATLSCIGIASAAYFQFSWSFGSHHSRGVFHTDSSGNAWTISFDRTAGLDGVALTGDFTIETIGKVTFNSDTQITPPSSGKVTDLWGVIGTASSLAGPIDLTSAQYDPIGKRLIGYGMNHGIGKIPFGAATVTIDPSTWLPVDSSITTDTASAWFEWRVKVLGNIGGNSAFATFYSPGTRFNASIYNSTLNQMRKNIALLRRNVSFSNDPKPINNTLFIQGDKKYSDIKDGFPTNSIDSLVIIGGDLTIDWDVMSINMIKPKGIIVMKDESGAGWNIIVQGSVKKIQASIFTEWSLYSWASKDALYNDIPTKILTLPENQLYIKGSLISRNTIGWATQDSALCIYGETACGFTQALRYDLNYFRLTPPNRSDADPTTRSYSDNSLDNYSLIIERDPRISSDPPPGWENK